MENFSGTTRNTFELPNAIAITSHMSDKMSQVLYLSGPTGTSYCITLKFTLARYSRILKDTNLCPVS